MAVENTVVFESTRKRKFFALKITSIPGDAVGSREVAFRGMLRDENGTYTPSTMRADVLLGLTPSRGTGEAWQATGTQRYEG